jgi:hypothetical protein
MPGENSHIADIGIPASGIPADQQKHYTASQDLTDKNIMV